VLDPFLVDDTTRRALREALQRCPAAEAARHGLARVLERAADGADLLARLASGPGLSRALALLGLGGAPVEATMARPEALLGLGEPLPDPAQLEARVTGASLDQLRALRRETTLAVAARELAGELDAVAAAGQLSRVADIVLAAVLRHAREEASRRHGDAARAARLVVLALGKLGGVELNYSSDVDLILVRADDAPAAPALAVARAFVNATQASSAQGRLYKVDLRLRPYGKSGELVPSQSQLLDYHRASSRTWERQALLKARVVCGDMELGRALLGALAPVVFRRLDAAGIRQILALRDRIAAHADDAERDVKHGPGGIRDVEFAVQFLQLLHGHDDPSLRATATLEAVTRLCATRHLSHEEAAALTRSYHFLRRLEHLLQLTRDRELTRLPRGDALTPLAECLGLEPAELERQLGGWRRAGREVLDRLLRAPFAEPPGQRGDTSLQDLLLHPERAQPASIAAALRETFQDPEAAWRHLLDMGVERNPLLAPSGRARTVLAGLSPRLLESIRARPQPDRTLRNVHCATANLGAKATVWQLLAEDPDALGLLVDLAAGSDVLPAVLARHPGVFDEVIDRLLTRARPARAEVEAEVLATLREPGDPEPRLRQVRALHLLAVGALDLGGRGNVQNTARSLGEVAEGFLCAFVIQACAEAAERHGGAPRAGRLAVFAVGRLGGRELSYAGDADLIALYDGDQPAPDGTAAGVFWSEVVQRVVALGTGSASAGGALLPIDLRLRPGGAEAPLAVSSRTALAYYRGEGPGDHARDFERLALQKLRPVAGDPALLAALQDQLEDALYGRPHGDALWEELLDMRARQREAHGADDLKWGRGGLAQVELVASALALRHGGRRHELRQPNAVALLQALERCGLLSRAEHLDLRTAYAFLRRLLLRLRVASWQAISELPTDAVARHNLARGLGYVAVGETPAIAHFEGELRFHRGRVEAITTALIERDMRGGGAPASLGHPDEKG
jgi:glutamate-ammonia-ligase adenylyltransferase